MDQKMCVIIATQRRTLAERLVRKKKYKTMLSQRPKETPETSELLRNYASDAHVELPLNETLNHHPLSLRCEDMQQYELMWISVKTISLVDS